jgi:hypothetical protein
VNDNAQTILKFCLLALLYLFLLRVVWVVSSEMRAARNAPAPEPVREAPPKQKRRGGWQLVTIAPKHLAGQAFPIDSEVTIGRAPGCAIRLVDDTFVSSLHARVFERDGTVWVEDLGSTNGTTLNGGRVTTAMRVRKGDRLQVGDTELEARR